MTPMGISDMASHYTPSPTQSPQRALDTFEAEYYALHAAADTNDRAERIALYEKTIASYRAKAG